MSGRGPAPEASGASCSAQSPPADAPQAVLPGMQNCRIVGIERSWPRRGLATLRY